MIIYLYVLFSAGKDGTAEKVDAQLSTKKHNSQDHSTNKHGNTEQIDYMSSSKRAEQKDYHSSKKTDQSEYNKKHSSDHPYPSYAQNQDEEDSGKFLPPIGK